MDTSYLRKVESYHVTLDQQCRADSRQNKAGWHWSIHTALGEVCKYLESVDIPEDQSKKIEEQQRQIDLLERKVSELNFALETVTKMIVEWRK